MKIFPVFAVADLDQALSFCCDVMGFETVWTFGDPPHRAGVAKDDVEVHLDAQAAGAPPGPSVVYCHMDDVERYYRELQARGLTFALTLDVRPRGMKDFRVEDPFGNRLGFASRV